MSKTAADSQVPSWPEIVERENEILALWEETRAFQQLREKNSGGPAWSFFDGPITANNPMGVHHAWGRTIKDVVQRYRSMLGCELRYQNGFDCQGLWVEVEVERALGFTRKPDIEAYGIARFVGQCKERVYRFGDEITRQSRRLGYWMDWENSYWTLSDENNYAIWNFLKRCHERGLIYQGNDVMPWCPRCGTGISQHETHEGYKETTHTALVVKFPLRERPGALLVWTTTPWTLTSNVAAAVHPELTYVRVHQGGDVYYLAEATLSQTLNDGYEIEARFPGEQLVGLTYDGPFDDIAAQAEARQAHQVIPWKEVSESEGTGIVHIAPGCGREDFELGKEYDLPIIAPINEEGCFLPDIEPYVGQSAAEVADDVVDYCATRGRLYRADPYTHSYPHCWRCGTQLLFRAVDEWFIAMDPWREEIMESARMVRWLPDFGLDLELDWLRNMGDWMISKKRYWGLALPIWKCRECGSFDVIGGRDELRERARAGWETFDGQSPHRPWIDAVTIRCKDCHGTAQRVADVGNPWLDAGIIPFSTTGYTTDHDYWRKWYPADFVTECFPGQFRNWFYALLAMSTMLEKRAPFTTLLGHALVRDEHGEEMHKSSGNAISFDEAVERVGADPMRWLYCRQNPTQNLNFGYPAITLIRNKFFDTLENVVKFYLTYAEIDQFNPARAASAARGGQSEIDRWILSRLERLVTTCRASFEDYDFRKVVLAVEEFVDDLSNWYVRQNRRRFWKSEDSTDKQAAFFTLYECLEKLTRLIAPIVPFTAESIYQRVVRPHATAAPVSVHLLPYPTNRTDLVDTELEIAMTAVRKITSLGLAARMVAKVRVRQPLPEMLVLTADDKTAAATQQFQQLLEETLNVKHISVHADESALPQHVTVKPNFRLLGPRLGKLLPEVGKVLEAADHDAIVAAVTAGQAVVLDLPNEQVELSADDLLIETTTPQDLAVQSEPGITVALHTALPPELRLEGMARDVARLLQKARKDMGLEVENRIRVTWQATDAELGVAIQTHQDYIATEILATSLTQGTPSSGAVEYALGSARLFASIEKAELLE